MENLEEFYDRETEVKEAYQQGFRDAAKLGMRSINAILSHMGGRILDPKATMKDATVDYWSLAYALGSWICGGMSMRRRAPLIGISHATLSKNAVEFCIGNDLPPSEYMKDPETMQTYMLSRTRAIEKENKKHE